MDVAISSYWTFSDVFEEGTLIPTPFHGGFGLLTITGTPKPAYRAFQLLHGTGTRKYEVSTTAGTNAASTPCQTDAGVLVTDLAPSLSPVTPPGAGMRVFMYNHPKNFETEGRNCNITVNGLSISSQVKHARIDQENSNPMQTWLDMGSPTYPNTTELAKLEVASELTWTTTGEGQLHSDGTGMTFEVPPNGLVVADVFFG
jgi:xylan 1,4-beta-xylosidase